MTDAVALAGEVLSADGQPFATLSLAPGFTSALDMTTTVEDARRRYMLLAGLIHPDKLKGRYDKATQAFQCLVRAFESFVDPKKRKQAHAQLAKSQKKSKTDVKAKKEPKKPATEAVAEQPVVKKAKTEKSKDGGKKAPAPKRTKAKPARRPKREQSSDGGDSFIDSDDDADDLESESSSLLLSGGGGSSGEDEFEALAKLDTEPPVSTSRTLIGEPRTGGDLYRITTIGCPQCRTSWQPDSRQQYSLFMGKWNLKVHCQLCLFVFGSATAVHACPHCAANFHYDVSMYDSLTRCAKCKKQFGFPYYPVNQMLIDQVRLQEWREEKERQRTRDREARARHRYGGGGGDAVPAEAGGGGDSEETELAVGNCMVNDECPICRKRVTSKHRSHVLACLRAPPAAKKTRTRSAAPPSAVVTTKSRASRASSAKKTTAVKPVKKKAKPKAARRRARGSDSESDESFLSSDDDSDDEDSD